MRFVQTRDASKAVGSHSRTLALWALGNIAHIGVTRVP